MPRRNLPAIRDRHLHTARKGHAMKWEQEFAIGIQEIDEQHFGLTDHVSRVEQAVRQAEGWSAVHGALGRLARLAQTHFAVEESLMRIHAYALLDEHIDQHRQFYADLLALQERSLTTELSPKNVEFLHHWLAEHILHYDKAYAFHILKRTTLGGP
jgi:hemerythrin